MRMSISTSTRIACSQIDVITLVIMITITMKMIVMTVVHIAHIVTASVVVGVVVMISAEGQADLVISP